MIEVLVTKEINIIDLLPYALSECSGEISDYSNYLAFLKDNEDDIVRGCFEHLNLVEFDIDYEEADWYVDQIRNELKSKVALNYIEKYFNAVHNETSSYSKY